MQNPLLHRDELPHYAAMRPEHIRPALDVLLADAQTALDQVVAPGSQLDFDSMSLLLDVPLERLSRAWGVVNHLTAVADTAELRTAYNDNLPRMSEFYTRIGADERLYARYKAITGAPDAAAMSQARRRGLDNAMRDFVLSGAELNTDSKQRFAAIQERLAELSQKFSENVLDATDRFSLVVDEQRLAGVPRDVTDAARQAAQADGLQGCKLSLQLPCWTPVMQYAHDRSLREQMYRAYFVRASEFGPAELDNGPLMAEILALRQEEARLLGFANFAELSLVPKMAGSPAEVTAFLRDMATRARPHAERDLRSARDFAATHLDLLELQPWDLPYVSEKLKEAHFSFSEQEARQYFTESKVVDGLFRIVETLFEVVIRPDQAATWHDSVRFYRMERSRPGNVEPELLGRFYLDLHARTGKRSGAWMTEVCSRWARPDQPGRLQTPVAQLTCNFPAPVGGRPTLLTHDDVITLFHELGHGLHHLLTQVNELSVAGISGVEWDAVELPSQFMENFCWEWAVLSRLTAHVDSGEPLPRELFERMHAARNFQNGLQTLRQVEFALLDMRLHAETALADRIQQAVDEVREEVAVLQVPSFNRSQHGFSHIFAGGYSAGYYSYKWAEVLSADAYGAFEDAGLFDPETGRRFRREILEAGGSRPAMESFRAFRGRDPTMDALMRHQGMS